MADESIDDIFKELDLIDEEEIIKKAESLANISFENNKITFGDEVHFSDKNEIVLDTNYFFDVANDIKADVDYISFKNLLETKSYDIIKFDDEELLYEKSKLKKEAFSFKFKHKYQKGSFIRYANKVFENYDFLKTNELFLNDYYPYRELAILYNEQNNPQEGLEIIEEFFNSEIYCDDVILDHFKYYTNRFLDKLDTPMPRDLQDSIEEYEKNRRNYKNDSIPIADRISSIKNNVQYMTHEKYEFNQSLFLLFCKARDNMYVKYKDRIKFNVNLMECEILYFKAWACNGLGFALKRMNSDNFYKIYDNEINDLVNKGNILEHDFNRIYSCKQIDIDYMNAEEVDNQVKFDELFSGEYRR